MTVADLIERLKAYPQDLPVYVGICDDEFNVAGGIFVPAEAIQPEEAEIPMGIDCVQITAWADIAQEGD